MKRQCQFYCKTQYMNTGDVIISRHFKESICRRCNDSCRVHSGCSHRRLTTLHPACSGESVSNWAVSVSRLWNGVEKTRSWRCHCKYTCGMCWCKYNHANVHVFNLQKAFAILGVCTCFFGAWVSVSVYLHHCEPNSGCKNLEKSIYGVGWTWWKCVEKR